MKLMNNKGNYEYFKVGFYLIKKPRLMPSFYRYPFWSFRWLWFTVTFDCFQRIHGANA